MLDPIFTPDCPDPGILQAFADGALPPDDHPDVAAHVQVCPTCRAQVEAAGALSAWAREHLVLPAIASDQPGALVRLLTNPAFQPSPPPSTAPSLSELLTPLKRSLRSRLEARSPWAAPRDRSWQPVGAMIAIGVPTAVAGIGLLLLVHQLYRHHQSALLDAAERLLDVPEEIGLDRRQEQQAA